GAQKNQRIQGGDTCNVRRVRRHDQRTISVEEIPEEDPLDVGMEMRLGLLHREECGDGVLLRLLLSDLLEKERQVDQVRSAQARLVNRAPLCFVDKQADRSNHLAWVGEAKSQ